MKRRWHRPTREQLASLGYLECVFRSRRAANASGWYPMRFVRPGKIVAFQVAALP